MPKVSVIIPCYNQGAYLAESVDSVLDQTFQDFEIIVVDDGSTDQETIEILTRYNRPKTRVVRTENQGLSAARNNGILEAMGEYILPLDADDKIGPGYLEDAVRILDRHPDIGIVYCEAAYFGSRDGHWPLPDYSPDQLLLQNVIFCSALFRRSHWEKVGGFNVNMVYGWEDWDFWLALVRLGVKVYRIPKVHFFYRLQETSMVHAMDDEKRFFMKLHVVLNQQDLYRKVAEINIHTKVAELFLDTGLGFTPREVIRQVVFGEERLIEFDLSTYGWIRQVRFHPINVSLVLRLDRIEATDELGCCLTLAPGQSNALWQDGSHWIFQADHPWITVDLSGVKNPGKFSIHFQYLAIGTEVYPEIMKVREQEGIRMLQMKDQEVNSLWETIRRKDEMIEDIMNSKSWRLTRPLRRLKEILKP